jgi:hypothetical protein
MLPAQKEIRESGLISLEDHVALSSGKLIDSAQNLRECLDEMDLTEITDAVERISNLQQRLLAWRRAMAILAEVSSCQSKVLQARNEIAQELNRVKSEILRKPFSSREPEDKDKLITIRGLPKKLNHAPNRPDPLSAMVDDMAPARQDSASISAAVSCIPAIEVTDQTEKAVHVFTSTDKIAAYTPEQASLTDITSQDELHLLDAKSPQSEKDQVGTRPVRQETIASLVKEFADGAGVENMGHGSTEETYKWLNSQAAGERSKESTLAPAAVTVEFDKKLLDDLIKNYGEFVVSPNLPAAAEPVNPSKKSEKQSHSRVNNETDRASDNTVVSYSSHGDLDRKLKKLIKDYGQVDLYSQRSWFKTKIRAVAAFAVLGAVLTGIYFFFAPKTNVALNPSATHAQEGFESTAGEPSDRLDKERAAGSKDSGQLADQLPKATEVSGSFALKGKQTLQKNIKKGGSQE